MNLTTGARKIAPSSTENKQYIVEHENRLEIPCPCTVDELCKQIKEYVTKEKLIRVIQTCTTPDGTLTSWHVFPSILMTNKNSINELALAVGALKQAILLDCKGGLNNE